MKKLIFLLSCIIAAFASNIQWQKVNPGVTNGYLASVAYGNGRYVIVGIMEGLVGVVTSTDLQNWQLLELEVDPSSNVGLSVGFLPNVGFVIVFGQGQILTSPDGVNWKINQNNCCYFGTRMVAGNGYFLANDLEESTLHVSSDGLNWTDVNIPNVQAETVSYANGKFYTSSGSSIYSSTDGSNWNFVFDFSHQLGNVSNIAVVASGGENLLLAGINLDAGSAILTSSDDGSSWEISHHDSLPYAVVIAYADGMIIALLQSDTASKFIASTDGGQVWKPAQCELYGVPFALNNGFVAIGDDGLIQYSSDGNVWNTVNEGVTGSFLGMFYSDKLSTFVLSTDHGLYTSNTGKNWKLISIAVVYYLTFDSSLDLFYGITYEGSGSNITTSPDLVNWSTLGGIPAGAAGVAYSEKAKKWVITGNERYLTYYWRGYIWTSLDETATEFIITKSETSNPPSSTILNVIYQNGILVTLGDCCFYTSTDGINWNQGSELPMTVYPYTQCQVSYLGDPKSNGRFFFSCSAAGPPIVWTSLNGGNWTVGRGAFDVVGVSYGYINGSPQFVATGYNGAFVTSTDGLSWTNQQPVNPTSTFSYFASFGEDEPLVIVSAADDTIEIGTTQ